MTIAVFLFEFHCIWFPWVQLTIYPWNWSRYSPTTSRGDVSYNLSEQIYRRNILWHCNNAICTVIMKLWHIMKQMAPYRFVQNLHLHCLKSAKSFTLIGVEPLSKPTEISHQSNTKDYTKIISKVHLTKLHLILTSGDQEVMFSVTRMLCF